MGEGGGGGEDGFYEVHSSCHRISVCFRNIIKHISGV